MQVDEGRACVGGVLGKPARQYGCQLLLRQEGQEGLACGGAEGRQPLTDCGGDLHPLHAFDHLQVDDVCIVEHGKVDGFTALCGQALQMGLRPTLQVHVLEHKGGHFNDAQAEVVLPCDPVTPDETSPLKRHQ